MEEDVGRVLIVSCSSFLSPKDVISEMFAADVPEPKQLTNGLSSYFWKIENKYFTADVHLCSCASSSLPTQCEFAVNVNFESVIIIFDRNEKSSFKEAKTWLPYVESQNPSVLLLLDSGKGSGEGVSQAEVVKWCLDNSFELVNMVSEDIEDEEEEDDDFREKTGVERVIEALQCAEWPNMKMRDDRIGKSSTNSRQNQKDNCAANSESSTEEKRDDKDKSSSLASDDAEVSKRGSTMSTDELELLGNLASDGAESESFEELFQKLAVMKERAASLPADQRKDYAEKVAIAFWRAMGGSEEEISGLTEGAE